MRIIPLVVILHASVVHQPFIQAHVKKCQCYFKGCTAFWLLSSGLHQIPLSFMVDILAAQCLPYAIILLSLLPVYSDLKNYRTLSSRIIQLSKYIPCRQDFKKLIVIIGSVRREHKVFINLIDSYPGLLDHLTRGEEEDIIHVGELVSSFSRKIITLIICS